MQKSACYIILLQFGVIHQSRITFLSANVIDVTDSFPFRFFFGMMHTGGPISGIRLRHSLVVTYRCGVHIQCYTPLCLVCVLQTWRNPGGFSKIRQHNEM